MFSRHTLAPSRVPLYPDVNCGVLWNTPAYPAGVPIALPDPDESVITLATHKSASAVPSFNSNLSVVSFHVICALSSVPRSISSPAFSDGVPVSSAFNVIIASPISTQFEHTAVCVPATVKLPPI